MKKMKFKLIIAMALAAGLLTSAIGFSVFAGGPYDHNTLPGYHNYQLNALDENGKPIVDENGDYVTYEEEEIEFKYNFVSPYDNEEISDCVYPVYPNDEVDSTDGYFQSGYTISLSEIFDLTEVGEDSYDENDNMLIFRGWSLSEGGAVVTQVTEENFGCTFYPIFTPATEEEEAEINAKYEADRINHEENGVAIYSWDAGVTDEGDPYEAGYTYLLQNEIKIVVTPLTGDALAAALAKAGVDDENIIAYDIKIYPFWDEDHEDPIQVREGKTVHVQIPKPDVKDATSFKIIHIKDDGSLEELNAVINGEYLEFDTPSFSAFVPSPGGSSGGSDDSTTTTTTTTAAATTTTAASNADKGSTNSPGTGENSLVPVFVIFALSILATAGAVCYSFFRKRTVVEGTEE